MKIYDMKMIPQIAENLKHLMNNKRRKVEIEEKIKTELLHYCQHIDPDQIDLNIRYNRMSNNYEIHIFRKE